MKYNYAVKVNGEWYPPNTEIPDNVEAVKEKENENEDTHAAEGADENDQGTSGKPKSRNTNK